MKTNTLFSIRVAPTFVAMRPLMVFGWMAFAALFVSFSAFAADVYPSRPINIVVPFAPGGPTDVIARTLAQHLRVSLGQNVIIENVAGANGNIGVGKVARAAADGYTISIGHWSTHVVNGAVFPLTHDVLKDFEPISLIATNSYLIVAKNAVPANDLKSFIAWLKANPDKASEGTAGAGSPQHVSGVFFQNATGTRFQFIPYRGAAPAMLALMAGEIDLIIDDPTSSLPQVRAGKIKAFAVTAKHRLSAAPDIPTVDESGLPGFYFSRWHALWAPKATPKDVIAKLNAAVVAALADPWCARGSPISDRKFFRAINRHRRRSPLFTRPKSKSGGRSSRRRHQGGLMQQDFLQILGQSEIAIAGNAETVLS